MAMSTMKVIVAVTFCVVVSVITAKPAVEDPLRKMNQASADVMAIVKELQEKMLAEEGFKVAEILTLLDRFCEEKMFIEDLEKEVESGLSARRYRRSDCQWTTKCKINSKGEWECSVELVC